MIVLDGKSCYPAYHKVFESSSRFSESIQCLDIIQFSDMCFEYYIFKHFLLLDIIQKFKCFGITLIRPPMLKKVLKYFDNFLAVRMCLFFQTPKVSDKCFNLFSM